MAVFFFFTNYVRNVHRKSCKYIRNNSTRQKGKKNFNSTSFERNGMEIYDQQRLESLEEKKAVHTLYRHGVRRICKLYTKRRPFGKLT